MIEIYTLPNCPNCKRLKEFCKNNNINFIERDVEKDFRAKARLVVEGFEYMPVISYEDSFYECRNLEELKQKIMELINV
jgi:glutaredoxin